MCTGEIVKHNNYIKAIIGLVSFIIVSLYIGNTLVWADGENTIVTGNVYEFEKNSDYSINEIGDPLSTNTDNTYGSFFIDGDVILIDEETSIPTYEVDSDTIRFFYNYDNALLSSDEDSWHLAEDKSKTINGISLDTSIKKGIIVIQTSKDQLNWIDAMVIPNAFEEVPVRMDSIYSATDVQLASGCYYRVSIAYEICARTKKDNILFINTDKYEYKKYLEVYEFYAYSNTKEETYSDQTYSLGTKAKVKTFEEYAGEDVITKNDMHYGWDIGNFFVSGYTEEVSDTDGTPVFLKNVGDKVTLWFNLKQNLDALNGNENLSITADKEGLDRQFETSKTDFGRGALIIRETDRNNNKTEAKLYSNYLEANTEFGADTKVRLFEEGDYEVALDYEVTNDKLIDKIGHYRIYFKFSVRNGNCMVYPLDSVTGAELSNSSITENGFKLDLTNSKYLKINLKREVLTESADGLTEDTRFNGPAKDGAIYNTEGLYTITVSNDYTKQFTVKKIYVGTNKILKAYLTTGLSIPEINNLVSQGADISKDGEIVLPTVYTSEDAQENEEDEIEQENVGNDMEGKGGFIVSTKWMLTIGLLIIVLVFIALYYTNRNKKRSSNNDNTKQNDEGGEK